MVLLITRDYFIFVISLAHPWENKPTQTNYKDIIGFCLKKKKKKKKKIKNNNNLQANFIPYLKMYCPLNEVTQTPSKQGNTNTTMYKHITARWLWCNYTVKVKSRMYILNSEKQTLYDTRKQINMLKSYYWQNYVHCILLL